MKFQKAVGGDVKNPVQARFLKKEIARMRTILHEREIANAKNKTAEGSDKSEVA